jgi:hypothetical protein
VNNNAYSCVTSFYYSGEGSNQTTKSLLCLARQICNTNSGSFQAVILLRHGAEGSNQTCPICEPQGGTPANFSTTCPVALVLTFGLLLATELRVPLSLSRIFLYTPGFIPLGFVSDASWNCCHLQSLPMLERTVEQLHPERSATIKRPTFPTTLFSNKREGKGAKTC